MIKKHKELVISFITIIFFITVAVKSCESRGNIASKDLMLQKVGSGVRWKYIVSRGKMKGGALIKNL